ncbi:MAG: hypothetical protein L0177_15665 [Chloroflexi bacterium]|nr:hypothetical protein [Chloroflexota bacterium]
MALRYVVIANPDSKRSRAYLAELEAFWQQRGAAPSVEVVPWAQIVPRDGNLDGLAAFDAPALVRLESPGRDAAVTRLLLQAGARDLPEESRIDWTARPFRKGELLRPGLLHRGFCRVLAGLKRSLDDRPHLTPLACPLGIAEMFDKNATSTRLAAAGLPCPPSLPPPDTPEQLLTALREHGFTTAYVKLAAGSSASGTAVVRPLDEPPWALTTMIRLDGAFFNTRRLQHCEGESASESVALIEGDDGREVLPRLKSCTARLTRLRFANSSRCYMKF